MFKVKNRDVCPAPLAPLAPPAPGHRENLSLFHILRAATRSPKKYAMQNRKNARGSTSALGFSLCIPSLIWQSPPFGPCVLPCARVHSRKYLMNSLKGNSDYLAKRIRYFNSNSSSILFEEAFILKGYRSIPFFISITIFWLKFIQNILIFLPVILVIVCEPCI